MVVARGAGRVVVVELGKHQTSSSTGTMLSLKFQNLSLDGAQLISLDNIPSLKKT